MDPEEMAKIAAEIEDCIKLGEELVERVSAIAGSRELSLVVTRAQEALFWLKSHTIG